MDAEVVIVPDPKALAHEAAERFAHLAREAAESRGRFGVALSGGSTPQALYRLLALEPYYSQVPWAQVHLFWADERSVPPDHPSSNYRLAYEALIAEVRIPTDNVHRIRGELAPDAAARAYDRDLLRFFGGLQPRFDLVLLGLGSDGHTASLFPSSAALEETKRLAVATTAFYGNRPAERVTLTLPVLNAARQVLFLVSGAEQSQDRIGCAGERRASPPCAARPPGCRKAHMASRCGRSSRPAYRPKTHSPPTIVRVGRMNCRSCGSQAKGSLSSTIRSAK